MQLIQATIKRILIKTESSTYQKKKQQQRNTTTNGMKRGRCLTRRLQQRRQRQVSPRFDTIWL